MLQPMSANRPARWRLDGKTALVTGASKGIGRATVEALAELGARVMGIARGAQLLEDVRQDWLRQGFDVEVKSADMSTRDGIDAVLAAVHERFGGLDIIVANVGINIRKATVEYDLAEVESVLRANFFGPYELLRAAYPLLAVGDGASIVLVGSVAGSVSVGTGTPYAASKAALEQLARTLAVEWAGARIRANIVLPAYTRTPLTESVLQQPERLRQILERTPLGRVAEPEEVAAAIAFLCLPAASYITGHSLAVDGGFLAKGL
jgi:tropinone reductase I